MQRRLSTLKVSVTVIFFATATMVLVGIHPEVASACYPTNPQSSWTRNNYGTAPINVSGVQSNLATPNNLPPANCSDSLYWVSTIFVDINGSVWQNGLPWNYIETGMRYYKNGTGTYVRFFVEIAVGGLVTPQEYLPSSYGCSVSVGSSAQPSFRIFKVISPSSTTWYASVQCGATRYSFPLTLSSLATTAHALGETEVFASPTGTYPPANDVHISNLWRSPGFSTLTPWGNFACLYNSIPGYRPVQAYSGYAMIPGSLDCNPPVNY